METPAQQPPTDRRQYARVPVQMTAWCRKVEHPDVMPRLQEQWAAAGPTNNAAEVLEKARLPEGISLFLQHMDAKMDALLGFVLAEKLDKEFPYTVRVVELSGSGVRVESDQPFQIGDTLELALMLHHAPVRVAGAMALVVRGPGVSTSESQDNELNSQWALDFIRIREHDLEAVVQFVFHEERLRLRERLRDRF